MYISIATVSDENEWSKLKKGGRHWYGKETGRIGL